MPGVDDISDIKDLYEAKPEQEDDRLVRHQLEYELTWRYLDAYLPPACLPAGGHILEVGAASGRYTLELAQRGYTVTAFDLSAALTALSQARLAEAGLSDRVTYLVGDARDLGALHGQAFDAALVMGPLYHLIHESDRRLVLRQIFGVLRPGGMVFTASISRFGILGDLMKKVPDWIEDQAEVRSIVECGYDPDHWPRGGFRGYFATVDEIAPLHEADGFETVRVAGVEPGISSDDESYNVLEGDRRRAWLDLLYEVSTQPSMVGASRHLLYIGRKPAGRQYHDRDPEHVF
ncbi:MAG: methyltransferase domain-containing protein [Chloroflexi bacterium]|nr:methyltransferase domain-containing protein [Chloroflexota bacterium]